MLNIPPYNTMLFTDVYSSVDTFLSDYQSIGLPTTITTDNASILYYLLYGKYGNTPIANYDTNQFKYKLFSVVWQYGPSWEKRLDIQETLRGLTQEQVLTGQTDSLSRTYNNLVINAGTASETSSQGRNDTNKTVQNHAYNPSTEPSTASLEELTYIDNQNVSNLEGTVSISNTGSNTSHNERNENGSENSNNNHTVGLLDGYTKLIGLLETDVTAEFLNKFQICFKKFVKPDIDFVYKEEA